MRYALWLFILFDLGLVAALGHEALTVQSDAAGRGMAQALFVLGLVYFAVVLTLAAAAGRGWLTWLALTLAALPVLATVRETLPMSSAFAGERAVLARYGEPGEVFVMLPSGDAELRTRDQLRGTRVSGIAGHAGSNLNAFRAGADGELWIEGPV